MKVVYSNHKLNFPLEEHSIFLAGPTPRNSKTKSWRPEALNLLDSMNYDGTVFVPERSSKDYKEHYLDQITWERSALLNCRVITFWIPRKFPEMPGFTTNVEFGLYINSGKVLYGRPNDSEKNSYLDWIYKEINGETPFTNLSELLYESTRFRRD